MIPPAFSYRFLPLQHQRRNVCSHSANPRSSYEAQIESNADGSGHCEKLATAVSEPDVVM